MSRPFPVLDLPRAPLLAALQARAASGPPLLLHGPPGAGKTTLLRRLAERLARDGVSVVSLDLMGAASSPERFVAAALDALPVARFGSRLGEATAIRRLAASGRSQGAAAVEALFALWTSLGDGGGAVLLLDEATEIRSLAYFKGLREADQALARALLLRGQGTILATSYPTLARRLWPELETLEVPPLTAAELAPLLDPQEVRLRVLPEALAQACVGLPRYLPPLLDGLFRGRDLVEVWADEMAEGGRLEQACRHTYEALLLRSRGYGMSKAVLATVAEEEGLNLTALVARLGRTPGAVRDYLGWLLGVDALRMVRKRYWYVDGLLRWWVRLHARGTPPSAAALRAAAEQAVAAGPASVGSEPAAAAEMTAVAASRETASHEAAPAPLPSPAATSISRNDRLMEID